jgi:hypothetical protein
MVIILYNNNYTKLFLIFQLYFLSSKSGSVNLSSSSIIVFKKEFNIKIKPKGQLIIRPVILIQNKYYYYYCTFKLSIASIITCVACIPKFVLQ